MSTKTFVAGYDFRAASNRTRLTDPVFVDRFVMNPDVTDVYSVDESIWSSVLKQTLLATDPTHYLGSIQNLPDTLAKVENFKKMYPNKTGIIIQIRVNLESASNRQMREWQKRLDPVQQKTDCDWKLLGVDVADSYLTTALSCLSASQKMKLMDDGIGQSLNRYHLFENDKAAEEFVLICDECIVEHAPFWRFSIWEPVSVP